MILVAFLPTVVAQGVPSSECPALTWDETRDGDRTVYRLTPACAALFECPAGFYCPAGAYTTSSEADALAYFTSTWSPDTSRCFPHQGFNSTTWSYRCTCGFGFWCATNTALPRFCPKEYYCRTPATINECRAGQYCKEGSVFGRPCTRFSNCPKESSRPQGSGGAIVVFIVLIFIAFLAFRIYAAVKDRRKEAANREMEDYLASLLESVRPPASSAAAREEEDLELKDVENKGDDEELGGDTDSSSSGFHIEFTDLRLTLPNGVTIMRGPCGEFVPGRSCAIMGASGAGKTTVMNLITGKVQKTSGTIKVNGEECESLEKWKSRVAFVPQEDVMHRRLTVLQNVEFSAYLRLPANLPDDQKHAKINKTLVALKLDAIKHSIIGDEFQRGISGGQRKRVNVALELVADPKVCFLDEPTSGLDSVSATDLCQMLRRLAEGDNLTIAAVIHSPGPAAFAAFHDFMLLQTGGRPVYAGPMPEVEAYFGSIGFKYDPTTMVDPFADYIMKAVAGTHKPDLDIATLTFDGDEWDHMTAFHELWHIKIGKEKPKSDDEFEVAFAEDMTLCTSVLRSLQDVAYHHFIDYPMRVMRQLCPTHTADPDRPTPNSCQCFALCFKRACRQVYATFANFLVSSIVVFFAIGAFMAAISPSNLNVLGGYPEDICLKQYPGLKARCRDLQQNNYVTALQFVGFIVAAANSAVAAATFGAEQPIYWREASTNLNTPAYFFAKVRRVFF